MNKILLLFIGLSLVLGACRKGEDDPFFSLKTRDARLKGEWKLVEKNFHNSDGNEDSFDGTTYTVKQNGVIIDQYPYQRTIKIEKGGTMKIETIADGVTYNSSNYWGWQNTDKKKTILLLYHDPYKVKRLSNKELVLELELDETQNGSNYAFSNTLKYEKQ